MDPITLSASLASIVGLLADFNESRRGTGSASLEEFKAWLTANRHDDVIARLEQNSSTLTSIKALLHEDRATLGDQIRELDKQLARLASGIDAFKMLASAVHPGIDLSDQAVSFLEQLQATGSSKFSVSHALAGVDLHRLDGGGSGLTITEPQFVPDDIEALQQIRFLTFVERNGYGDPVYAVTRSAIAFLRARPPPG